MREIKFIVAFKPGIFLPGFKSGNHHLEITLCYPLQEHSPQLGSVQFTMSGLEKGLQVIHITTPADELLCCRQDERVEDVLIRSEPKPYDQIPVKEQETIIGLLNKHECPQGVRGSVKDYMRPLGEQILVSADTSLLEFIQSDTLDRLVIKSTKIYGLVTRSDLLKLPASLLGFALVTHIETLMLAIIRSTNISKQE